LDGVVGRRKCWHRPVTGRIPRCRVTRHRSITIKELAGSRRSPLAMPSGQGRRMVGHMYGGNQSRVASQFLVRN
jgi:hypothetical protein